MAFRPRATKDTGHSRGARLFIAAIGLLGLIAQPRSTPNLSGTIHHGMYGGCVSPDVLGDTDGNSEPVDPQAAAVGMINAIGSVAGLQGPLRVRLPTHSNGVFFGRAWF